MIILTGKSASGKTSIVKELIEQFNYQKFVTYTTRKPRTGEVQDVDYHFVSVEEFLEKEQKGEFIETVQYSGNYYGTNYKDIGENKVLIVDPEGANKFSSQMNDLIQKKSAFFYIDCSEETAEKRMKNRGDKKEDIDKRLKSDKIVFDKSRLNRIDCIINTDKCDIHESSIQILSFYNQFIKQN